MPARKRQAGKGIVGDAFKFAKQNKLISSGLGMIPHPVGQIASLVAQQLGLGHRRRPKPVTRQRKAMFGRGIFSDLGGGIGSVFGGLGSGVGSIAHGLFGGGKKRRAVRPRAILV